MSQPEILRHTGPHQVSVTEGSKNAQSRHASERSALEPSAKNEPKDLHLQDRSDHPPPDTQLSDSAADSTDVWHGDDTMSLRIAQLKKQNLALGVRLQRLTGSSRKEESNE